MYKIVRMYFEDDHPTEDIRGGLTLSEARKWCKDKETSSSTAESEAATARTEKCGPWFDGYTDE